MAQRVTKDLVLMARKHIESRGEYASEAKIREFVGFGSDGTINKLNNEILAEIRMEALSRSIYLPPELSTLWMSSAANRADEMTAVISKELEEKNLSILAAIDQREELREQIEALESKVTDIQELNSELKDAALQERTTRESLEALKLCKLTGVTLIIAKLDRLSRNVEFTARLMNSGVEFIACDMPQANRFSVHIMSAVAEQEREAISQRTKSALQAAKNRGVVLGTPENLTDEARKRGQKKATLMASAHAQMCAESVWGIIEQLLAKDLSLRGISRELNERGIRSARGGTWTATSVKNIIARGLSL